MHEERELCHCQQGGSARPSRDATLAAERTALDKRAAQLLDELQWPDRRHAASRALSALGFADVRDGLRSQLPGARHGSSLQDGGLGAAAGPGAGGGGAGERGAALAAPAGDDADAAAVGCGRAYWARHAFAALNAGGAGRAGGRALRCAALRKQLRGARSAGAAALCLQPRRLADTDPPAQQMPEMS